MSEGTGHDTTLDRLSASFVRTAAEQFHGYSPLYERLALAIASDREMLQLAARSREGQVVPLLFLGAVQFLLLRGVRHPLSAFYPSVSGEIPPRDGDPYPAFRSFCMEHYSEIASIVSARTVQTNEVQRCAALLPAFPLVGARSGGRPLALVELGASAGLLLLWDRYSYDYGEGRTYGDAVSPVHLTCELRGDLQPTITMPFPAVVSRIGIDLHPVDVRDSEETLWLKALIWPGNPGRLDLLERAIGVARKEPLHLVEGDVFTRLPELLASVPADSVLCVFNSYVLVQFPREARERLDGMLRDFSRTRPFYRVSNEWLRGEQGTVTLAHYENGEQKEELLAESHPHGKWIRWLVPT